MRPERNMMPNTPTSAHIIPTTVFLQFSSGSTPLAWLACLVTMAEAMIHLRVGREEARVDQHTYHKPAHLHPSC